MFVSETHTYLRELPLLMDAKVSILSAASIGSFLYLLSLTKEMRFAGTASGGSAIFLFAIMLLAWICCSAAIGASFASLWARTSGSAQGCVSFLAIQGCDSPGAYLARLKTLDAEAIESELAMHNFELAAIAFAKAKWTNRAIISLGIGISCIAVAVALSLPVEPVAEARAAISP